MTPPARAPSRVTLEGAHVRLEPLALRHAASLYAASHGPGQDALWRYLFQGPFASRGAFDAWFGVCVASQDPLWFGIVDQKGEALGMMALMRIEPTHRVIEVGGILLTPALQNSVGATEAQYLLARHVFEDLGFRRYEWKCDDRNAPSKRAALRLGFTFEGVFRQHMIVKDENRDTAWFSMLDREWPVCQDAFARWLAPANFDAQGKQIAPLAALRAPSS